VFRDDINPLVELAKNKVKRKIRVAIVDGILQVDVRLCS
jgi:hypothetical protein